MGNRIKTREIGERFKMDGVLYEVAEAVTDDPCEGCSIQNEKGLVCRGDNKQVVFKEVSENEKPLESLLNGDFTGETSEVWP